MVFIEIFSQGQLLNFETISLWMILIMNPIWEYNTHVETSRLWSRDCKVTVYALQLVIEQGRMDLYWDHTCCEWRPMFLWSLLEDAPWSHPLLTCLRHCHFKSPILTSWGTAPLSHPSTQAGGTAALIHPSKQAGVTVLKVSPPNKLGYWPF